MPPFWVISDGSHFCFLNSTKNIYLVEGIEILFLVKFHWIPLNDFREKVENVPAYQGPGQPSCFSDRPEKHKVRGHWDLASCQVLLNSVQQFLEENSKMSQPIWGQGSHLVFLIGPKNTTWLRTMGSCFLSSFLEFHSAVSERKSKKSQPIRGQGSHLVFPICPKSTNVVEGVEILLPVKFPWILFSGCRVEVENVSANQRPWWPSCFFNRPEKHKLVRGHWDLSSYQVSLYSVKRFQRSWKCLSQSEARAAIRIGPKNKNFVEDLEILLPIKFL